LPKRFRHQLRVRYAECDAQGLVFNANYLAFYDLAITELWREALGAYSDFVASGVDMVVAEARLRFLAPARFDDELVLEVTVTRLGTTALGTELRVLRAGTLLCEAALRHVFVDAHAGTKIEIPAGVRAALEPYLIESSAQPG
jgi:acyl-CoA thioester hydrolase